MLGFLPEIYPDELLYSLMSRYANRSGYLLYRAVAEELFCKPKELPNILFLNQYTDNVQSILTKNKSMDSLIQHHTMFNNYGLFLPIERKKEAYDSLLDGDRDYHQKLQMSKSGKEKTLKFCPVCAQYDLQNCSETYWHRSWQIEDIEICPIHHCYLQNTDISLRAKTSPAFITAEDIVPNNADIINSKNERQIELAKYMHEVFNQDTDFDNPVLVGEFLHSRLEGTKYLSPRGQQRNISKLQKDFVEYYKDLENNDFVEIAQIQKVFTNKSYKFKNICMLGMFLNIKPYDLVNRILPEHNQIDRFEKQIHLYHEQGMNYREIAEKLDASYDVVKMIGAGRYGASKKVKKQSHNKCGAKIKDWNNEDLQMLPKVKKIISDLWEDESKNNRPRRITTCAITQKLNVHSKQFEMMPLCKKEIKKYEESFPEFWAREVFWAVNYIHKNGYVLNWKQLRNLTNLNRKNYQKCIPFLGRFFDDELLIFTLKNL